MSKITTARTFLPEILAPGTGLSPVTPKSVVPFNNVTTIQDIMNGDKQYKVPSGGGDWSDGWGEDTLQSYMENGDLYKRRERDLDIMNKMMSPNNAVAEEWKVRAPGGVKTFTSFDLAQRYKNRLKEKGIQVKWMARTKQAQNQPINKVELVTGSIQKTFKVETIDSAKGAREVGSAFCVANGFFVTCAHVVGATEKVLDLSAYSNTITVSLLQAGRKYPARVIAVDTVLDIAILQSNIDTVPFELDITVNTGDDIMTVGSPLGFENNVSFGNVGSTNRTIYPKEGAAKYMFVDSAVFSGNSGGPIVKTSNGKVIGMITAIVTKSGDYGLNIGLPSSYIQKICIINNVRL